MVMMSNTHICQRMRRNVNFWLSTCAARSSLHASEHESHTSMASSRTFIGVDILCPEIFVRVSGLPAVSSDSFQQSLFQAFRQMYAPT